MIISEKLRVFFCTAILLSTLIIACGGGGSSSNNNNSASSNDEGSNNDVIHVTGISLDKTSVSFNHVGPTEQLTATITPADASNQKVVWTSSDESIVKVSSSGLVTAVGEGTATVQVRTDDGGFTADCTITIARSWGTAALIESGTNNAENPQIAINKNGHAVVVWQHNDNIYANRFTPSSGWGTPELIETDTGQAKDPQIAIDDEGNAIAVWVQNDGNFSIYANRFKSSTGNWGTAELIENKDFEAQKPQIAINGNGDAIVVWSHYKGGYSDIYANRFTSSTGNWVGEVNIESGTGDAQMPQVAIDSAGNAIAVWHQYDGSHWNIYANRFTPSGGWVEAETIESGTGNAYEPHIAIDAAGNAIAVWYQHDGTINSIYANRFTPTSGWGSAELIELGVHNVDHPRVAIDGNGNAIAVWTQFDGSRWSVYANRFTPSSGWGSAETIESSSNDAAQDVPPQIAFDGNGNAIAVWQQDDSIYVNRFTPTSGWGTAVSIESGYGDAYYPQIAIDAEGNAIAVWQQKVFQTTWVYRIYANRFY